MPPEQQTEENQQDPNQPVEYVRKERDNLVDVIAARHREERDENMKAEGIDVIDTANLGEEITGQAPDYDDDEAGEPDTDQGDEQEEDTAASGDIDNNTDGDETITIKVDGEMIEVSKAEVDEAGGVRAYQTNLAADRRLEEAKRVLAEAKSQTAQHQGDNDQPSTTTSTGSEVSQEDLAKVVNAMQYGTEEEGTEALKNLLDGLGVGKQADSDRLEMAALINSQINYNEAMQKFTQDYPDIVGDNELMDYARMLDDKMVESGDNRPYTERFADIGEKIYAKMGKTSKSSEKKSQDTTRRRAKKESVAQSPDPAGGRSASTGGEQSTERARPRDVIAAMAKTRAGGGR